MAFILKTNSPFFSILVGAITTTGKMFYFVQAQRVEMNVGNWRMKVLHSSFADDFDIFSDLIYYKRISVSYQ